LTIKRDMAMLSSSKGWSNLKAQSTHGAAAQRVDMHMRDYRPNYNEASQVALQDARRLLPIIELRNRPRVSADEHEPYFFVRIKKSDSGEGI
jgi:hypothetical protein